MTMATEKNKQTIKKATKPGSLEARIESGAITEQRLSSMIRELNSQSPERLNAIAISDGIREYTYRQMFRQWDKYAEVFSALDITGENGSRVLLSSLPTSSVIFSVYALNMTGASVSMMIETNLIDWKELKDTIRVEGITDVILMDIAIVPEVYFKLIRNQKKLGIRNIIIVHSDRHMPYAIPQIREYAKISQAFIRHRKDCLFMDELIEKYEATEIKGNVETSENAAIILHTSGTSNGIRKPIPFTDKAINEAVAKFMRVPKYREMFEGTAVCVSGLPLCACYGFIDQTTLPLVFGGKLIPQPLVEGSPIYAKALSDYKATITFGAFSNSILENKDKSLDLSSLKMICIGGMYFSPDFIEKINKALRRMGMEGEGCSMGYGLSEVGGACFLAPPGVNDESFGYPLPGVKAKIYDEQEDKFYELTDGEHTGALFISTPSLSSGKIGDKTFFELDNIDGETYYNTNDLVHVNANGSLSYVGRTNKFFVNNDGVRYESSIVERDVSAQKGIVACGIVGEYLKSIRDTVPILYVKTDKKCGRPEEVLRKALKNIFVTEKLLSENELPYQCVIAEMLPLNTMGKVDTNKIKSMKLGGLRFDIRLIKDGDEPKDLKLRKGTIIRNAPPVRLGRTNIFEMPDMLGQIAGNSGKKPDDPNKKKRHPFAKEMPFGNAMPFGMPMPDFGDMPHFKGFDGKQMPFMIPCIPVMMPCMAMQPFGDMSKFRPPFFDDDDYDEDDEDADEDDCDERRCHGFPPFGKMGSFRPPFFDDEDDEDDEDADEDDCDERRCHGFPPFSKMGSFRPPFFDDEDDEEDEDADDDECDDEDDDDMPPFMQMGRHAPPRPPFAKAMKKRRPGKAKKPDNMNSPYEMLADSPIGQIIRKMFDASECDEDYED